MPQVTASVSAPGLILDVLVWVSTPYRRLLDSSKRTLPPVATVRAMIDTGATISIIDQAVIARLGVPSTGSVTVHSPTTGQTPQPALQYDVGLVIPGSDPAKAVFSLSSIAVIEADFSAHGGEYNALLGLDVLEKGILLFNGPAKTFTLTF
jgi:hypothetical protein